MEEIIKIRKKINEIDSKITHLLQERASSVITIGKIKKEENLSVIDENREKEIIDSLETDFQREIFKKILSESRKLQS